MWGAETVISGVVSMRGGLDEGRGGGEQQVGQCKEKEKKGRGEMKGLGGEVGGGGKKGGRSAFAARRLQLTRLGGGGWPRIAPGSVWGPANKKGDARARAAQKAQQRGAAARGQGGRLKRGVGETGRAAARRERDGGNGVFCAGV